MLLLTEYGRASFACFSKNVTLGKIWTRCVGMVERWNRTPGARPPARPPGFFFRQKQRSKNQIMRIHKKNVYLFVFLRKLI